MADWLDNALLWDPAALPIQVVKIYTGAAPGTLRLLVHEPASALDRVHRRNAYDDFHVVRRVTARAHIVSS
jgi:hypothetical protein